MFVKSATVNHVRIYMQRTTCHVWLRIGNAQPCGFYENKSVCQGSLYSRYPVRGGTKNSDKFQTRWFKWIRTFRRAGTARATALFSFSLHLPRCHFRCCIHTCGGRASLHLLHKYETKNFNAEYGDFPYERKSRENTGPFSPRALWRGKIGLSTGNFPEQCTHTHPDYFLFT